MMPDAPNHEKISRYVYACPALLPDVHLLYSSRSGALLELDDREWSVAGRWLQAGRPNGADDPMLRERMERALMVVPADEDEVDAVRQHRARQRDRHAWLSLTIAPTLQCNFRCTYCFEEHRAEYMTAAVVERLEAFVAAKLDAMPDAAGVAVCWFGGEPLLAPGTIERVQRFVDELCAKRGLQSSRSLITNAYLLDDRMLDRLVALGAWEMIQVTVDGAPIVHDGRRPLVSGRGTFERVVRNTAAAVRRGLPVAVRMNVDGANSDRASLVAALRAFVDHGAEGLVPRVYLGTIIDSTPECSHMSSSRLSLRNGARARLVLSQELLRLGFSGRSSLPGPKCVMCTADAANGFTISPRGLVFKCWNEIHLPEARAIESLMAGPGPTHDQAANAARWASYDPLAKAECVECKAMPACMGGCPWEAQAHAADHGDCGTLKFYPDQVVQLAHAEQAIRRLGS